MSGLFFRSFFLQAAWNYESMQSIGFLYSIFPELKKLYGEDSNRLRESCLRHLSYFNTHPYVAGLLMSYAVDKERRIVENREEGTVRDLAKEKLQIAGPLAAFGDKFFWSTWRPFCGILFICLAQSGLLKGLSVPGLYFLFYNVPVTVFRFMALKTGEKGKGEIISLMSRLNRDFIMKNLPNMGILLVCVCISLYVFEIGTAEAVLFGGLTMAIAYLRKRFQMSTLTILYIVSLLFWSAAYFFGS